MKELVYSGPSYSERCDNKLHELEEMYIKMEDRKDKDLAKYIVMDLKWYVWTGRASLEFIQILGTVHTKWFMEDMLKRARKDASTDAICKGAVAYFRGGRCK